MTIICFYHDLKKTATKNVSQCNNSSHKCNNSSHTLASFFTKIVYIKYSVLYLTLNQLKRYFEK